MFDDATAAEGFLERCRGEGLDAVVEDARPIGTVKRNGPGLASWLKGLACGGGVGEPTCGVGRGLEDTAWGASRLRGRVVGRPGAEP